MTKPRTARATRKLYVYQANGRTGRIKYWKKSGLFGTYFRFGAKPVRNSFKTWDAAHAYLVETFNKLDDDRVNSATVHPVNHSLKTYSEMEHRLREHGNGATLLEAVNFYILHNETKKFKPRKIQECIELALEAAKGTSISNQQTLAVHWRAFAKEFSGDIHRVSAVEIQTWLNKRYANVKTQKNVRGSVVQLFKYAHETLDAIPETIKVAPQKVKTAKPDRSTLVEIYTPKEMEAWLFGALEYDIDLIPPMVIGGFEGLRPSEIHGERSKHEPLAWEAFDWHTSFLNLHGHEQKVRGADVREVPIHKAAAAWLAPFKNLKGKVWTHGRCYNKKLNSLSKKLKKKEIEVSPVNDGFRHSYASYRIKHLRNDINKLAEEMGNSAREILNSYKRNVADADADKFFGIMPPKGYAKKIAAVLASRLAA